MLSRLCVVLSLLPALLLADTVTVTPWCANSMRIRISKKGTNEPAVFQKTRQALAQRLQEENLDELPGAFVDTCAGTPVTPQDGKPLTNGNLVVTITGDNMKVTRKDNGKTLFTAKTTFTPPKPKPPQPTPKPSVCAAAQVGMDQTGGRVLGSLRNKTNAECCAACIANKDCDVWITGDKVTPVGPHGCFLVQNPTGTKKTPPGPSFRTMGRVRDNSRTPGGPNTPPGFYAVDFEMEAGDKDERIYGLGQGNWTCLGGCATGCPQVVVPLERNGQTVELLQRKFHVTIPFVYSTGGYGFVFNMFGYGHVQVGTQGVGGMRWQADAALELDVWVTSSPPGSSGMDAESIYSQYADATGHAPMLREDAMIFWQSRNRYKSSAIALAVAEKYRQLDLPVGVLVIDYKNQNYDGDFAPGPTCYPSLKNLSAGVRDKINASTVFSFWPEVKVQAQEYKPLKEAGCLINSDLGGLAVDSTIGKCREMIWSQYIKPRYYDQGVTAYWLDETDGEGTAGGDVPGGDCDTNINDCGGYQTSFGPAIAYSNLWVNQWLAMYSDPVATLGEHLPLVLTRGVWAGGQRHGIVLWSSDIESSFAELTAQVPQGVHASLSGIPWWTTDVGGYGCGYEQDNNSPYMRELIVRWYQFGCFCPVFRTHGHRKGPDEPNVAPCNPRQSSGGPNEAWSYGADTQEILSKYIRLRATMKPYIQELAQNVTARGVPTMRPLWYEFPTDPLTRGVNDQYFLGNKYLVAPVTVQGATNRSVYFPGAGVTYQNVFDASDKVTTPSTGGIRKVVQAPLEIIPVYIREGI